MTDELETLEVQEGTSPETDKCWVAMKAAMETVGEYCGGVDNSIKIGGMSVTIPQSLKMYVIQNEASIPSEDLVKTVIAEPWTQEKAAEMCRELLGLEPDTHECNRCVETTARQLAERIVDMS